MLGCNGLIVFVVLLSINMGQLLSQIVKELALIILEECAEVTGRTQYTEQAKSLDHITKWTDRVRKIALLIM